MKKILDTVRGYKTARDRKCAIQMLRKQGFNHFVCYKDVKSNYALMYGKADWCKGNSYYVNW